MAMKIRYQQGLTLIELMVTVAIAIILTTTAVPTSQRMVEKQRLTAAAEGVYAQLHAARSESGKRSVATYAVVSSNDTQSWALGVSDSSGCTPTLSDCTLSFVEPDGSSSSALRVISNADYPGVVMEADASGQVTFDPVRATSTQKTIELRSDNYEVRVNLSVIGRLNICSPDDASDVYLGRYPAC